MIVRTETQSVTVPIFGMSGAPLTPEALADLVTDSLDAVVNHAVDGELTSSKLHLTIERTYTVPEGER